MLLTIVLGFAAMLAAETVVAAWCVVGLAQVRRFRIIAMRYLEMRSAQGCLRSADAAASPSDA
jgi:hypothetical protein